MDVGRRHKIPRSEKKDFIIYGIPGSMRFLLAVLSKSVQVRRGSNGCYTHHRFTSQLRNFKLGKPKIL